MKNTPPNLRLLFSLGYWFGAHSFGLLIHPYQSTRKLVRDQFYRPLVYLPGVTFVFWWLAGFVLARFNVLATLKLSLVAQAIDLVSFKQYLFVTIFLWGTIFLLLWQVLLLYLFKRFSAALD